MLAQLSRLLLVLGLLALGYGALVTVIAFYPGALVVVVGVMAIVAIKRNRRSLWAHGTARFADYKDLCRSGMIEAAGGILIGRMHPVWSPSPAATVPAVLLWQGRRTAAACRLFLDALRRKRRAPGPLVRLQSAVHTAVFAPVGAGKSTGFAIPLLLSNPEATVVLDFKAELAKATAAHRRQVFGHRIVLLDPFGVLTEKSDQFNPLDFIDKESPESLDDCRDFGAALVTKTGNEKEPHWLDSAEGWIAGMTAAVVNYAPSDDRSLQTVRRLLTNPVDMKAAIDLLCASDRWDGIVSRIGYQLTHFQDKELGSTLTTTNRFLRFLDTPAIAKNTAHSTFDPADLNKSKMTIYCILPPEHMRAQAALLRMWITAFLRAVVRGGLSDQRRVNFVLDEAAALQHLEAIDDAIDKYRGYGVRLHFIFQSLGQLPMCFPDGRDHTFLSNTSQIFFGVNEPKTAEYISNRLGEATIMVDSSQSGRSRSYNDGYSSGNHGVQYSDNSNTSWSQQARKLLKPEEVIALGPKEAITFTPGLPPIRTTLVRYFEEPWLWRKGFFGRLAASLGLLIRSAMFLILGLIFAGVATFMLQERQPGLLRFGRPQQIYINPVVRPPQPMQWRK